MTTPALSASPGSALSNFAEAVAEGRGKAQADTLRKARKDTV
jgi:high-affinity K+ transport system ATPase subunit B